MRGAKRKRLAKACDACHKSKRRCDGTAPCSNCFFASKQCTYTDASGRPVPAPHRFESSRATALPSDTRSSSFATASQPLAQAESSSRYIQPSRYPYPSSSSIHPPLVNPQPDATDDDRRNSRKRFRSERGNAIPPEDLIIDGPVTTITMDRPAAVKLDHGLTRELTNLFFAHCNPARAIIHKPTFTSNLAHNCVPAYLLHAVCALAAPLSKQPRIRTSPSRFAGKPFAQEALSLMFDGAGRLICEPNLAAAQALCLLQMHDIVTKESNAVWESRYHDLALTIVDSLGVLNPEHPTLTPVPSQEFISASLEREAIRRIFWYIHLIDVKAAIYFKKPITFTPAELRLRLPVDETSFELGVHSTLPEYLHLPAVKMQYASEFGHVIRIITIYARVELILDDLCAPYQSQDSLANANKALLDAEHHMEEWARTLPDHLRFSDESLDVQQSMFDTSANIGAWFWCCHHVYYAACALAISFARLRNQRDAVTEPQWALRRIEAILKMLGDRAKNSLLLGAALWILIKYCKRDDAQIRAWCADYEDSFGTRMFDLVADWKPHPSPPQRHLFQLAPPPHSQSQSQQQQQQQQPQQQRPPFRFSDPSSASSSSFTSSRPPAMQNGVEPSQTVKSPTGTTSSYLRARYGDDSSSQSRATSPPARPPAVQSHYHDIRESRSGPSHLPPPRSVSNNRSLPPLTGGDLGVYSSIKAEKESSSISRSLNDTDPDGPGGGTSRCAPTTTTSGDSPDGSAPDSGPPSSRNSVIGEGTGTTLPPLKGSGLLEWNTGDKRGKGSRSSPRRSPPLPPLYQNHDEGRPTVALGVPVGLPWLASESR